MDPIHQVWGHVLVSYQEPRALAVTQAEQLQTQRFLVVSSPGEEFFGQFWIFVALLGVKRVLEMMVSHRAPSSLNMSPYRPIWTHFRPIFMIFMDLILQTGKSCWHLGQAHDRFTTDSRQIHHRFTRDAS